MEKTLVIFKPSAVERHLVGEVLNRFERKGLIISAMKMIQLDEAILREHYSHLTAKPFFPLILKSMMATPVIVMVLKGIDAIKTVRLLTGATNGREALPGTVRGDYCSSNQANIVHASSSAEDAEAEIKRFFKPEEIIDWMPDSIPYLYADDEL